MLKVLHNPPYPPPIAVKQKAVELFTLVLFAELAKKVTGELNFGEVDELTSGVTTGDDHVDVAWPARDRLDDLADELVAEDRSAGQRRGTGAGGMQVGAADAGAHHPAEHVVDSYRRHGDIHHAQARPHRKSNG